MGESITEGTITKWLKKVGDSVQRDEPIFEISTDKVDAEIPSPVAGVLSEIKVPEGSTAQINTVVAVIAGAPGTPPPPPPPPLRLLQHLLHPLPLHPRPQHLLRKAIVSARPRSFARSRRTTTSISPRSLAAERQAVSPSPTS